MNKTLILSALSALLLIAVGCQPTPTTDTSTTVRNQSVVPPATNSGAPGTADSTYGNNTTNSPTPSATPYQGLITTANRLYDAVAVGAWDKADSIMTQLHSEMPGAEGTTGEVGKDHMSLMNDIKARDSVKAMRDANSLVRDAANLNPGQTPTTQMGTTLLLTYAREMQMASIQNDLNAGRTAAIQAANTWANVSTQVGTPKDDLVQAAIQQAQQAKNPAELGRAANALVDQIHMIRTSQTTTQ